MSDRELPARPNLEQYKNQAKDLAKSFPLGAPDAVARVKRHHPRFHKLTEPEIRKAKLTRGNSAISSPGFNTVSAPAYCWFTATASDVTAS